MLRIGLFLLIGMVTELVAAAEVRPLLLQKGEDSRDVNPYLSYLHDRSGGLTIADIRDRPGEFRKFDEGHYVFPPSPDPYWIRFTVTNENSGFDSWFLTSLVTETREFRAWMVKDGVLTDLGDYGYLVPAGERRTFDYRPRVPLRLGVGETAEILIRARFFRLAAFKLDLMNFVAAGRFTFFNWGFILIYIGCLGSLILYNLFLFLTLRDVAYFWYVGFAGIMVFAVLALTGTMDLLGFTLGGKPTLEYGTAVLALVPALAVMFCRSFLRTRDRRPKTDRIMLGFVIYQSLVAVFFLFQPDRMFLFMISLANFTAFGLIFWAGVNAIREGFEPARYYLVAWGIFLVTVLYWTAGQRNLIPISYFNANSATLGNMLEMILMSLALGKRIKILQEQKTAAEIKAREGEAHQRLLRVLCHDLATPLSVITGFADMMLETCKEAKTRKYAEKIVRAGQIMVDITDGVRKLESSRAGKSRVSLEEVNLEEVFDQVLFLFEKRLKEKNVELRISLEEEGRRVVAEKNTLCNDVISNIVSNAIKFSSSGDTISVRSEFRDGRLAVSIRDQGVGMPADLIQKVFDPHEQTSRKGTANEEGTGFGMPLVKSYMDQYGGEVRVISAEKKSGARDHGTTITLTFDRPLDHAARPAA